MKKYTGRVVLVACRIMQPEIESIRQNNDLVTVHYLDQGLHRTPKKMARLVQEMIDNVVDCADRIILGYGLCANGIVGIQARQQGLIVPRCHDCISFFLGSPKAYLKDFKNRPGTYYLTPSWIMERKDPLGIIQNDYQFRFDRETAEWVMKEELKHYTHMVLIDTGVAKIAPLREIAIQNACFFHMEYSEVEGKRLEFFRKLIYGPYDEEEFIHLDPGNIITQEMFVG